VFLRGFSLAKLQRMEDGMHIQTRWFSYSLIALLLVSTFLMGKTPVLGEELNPKFVLIRLEDIGPGGQYNTVEQLGKLRAVMEFLHEQRVPFQLAVIPRWLNYLPDGTQYDQSLDHSESSYISAFTTILHQAELGGASVGMHGYTHQFGTEPRKDGFQETGIGNEFNIAGDEESKTPAFAEARIKEGIQIMKRAGFTPSFWEAPHYHSTPQQDEVFRRYFGLQYQSDIQTAPTPGAKYYNNLNIGSGAVTRGSVYIPTPFSYIPYNKDEHVILDNLDKSKNIVSFYFHPFLEFKQLLPQTDEEGNKVLRDGIPVYAYSKQASSTLQKLIANLKARHYLFYSLHDYIPFTPAASIALPQGQGHKSADSTAESHRTQVGDTTGDGQADAVVWSSDDGKVRVIPGQFRELRNALQEQTQVWANIPYSKGSVYTLGDADGDGKKDLWVVQPSGKLSLYKSTGKDFKLKETWKFPQGELEELYVFRIHEDWVIAGQSLDHLKLTGGYLHNGKVSPIKTYDFKSDVSKHFQVIADEEKGIQTLFTNKSGASTGIKLEIDPVSLTWQSTALSFDVPLQPGKLFFGDFNGDGKQDLLRWDSEQLSYTVYLRTESESYTLLSVFGPWGAAGARLQITDLDGNGKSDLALIGKGGAVLDAALSFERKGL
jgi:hypothetical protein